MIAPRERGTIKRIVYSRPALILLAVLFAFVAHGTWKVYEKASLAREQKNRITKELAELKSREADLQAKLAELRTERGLEEELRERFGVVKEGESVVVIVDPSDNGTSTKASSSGISRWWQKFLNIFRKE